MASSFRMLAEIRRADAAWYFQLDANITAAALAWYLLLC